MDHQGGGDQTGPRHTAGEPTGPQEALARGYPPGRIRQPQNGWSAPGEGYAPPREDTPGASGPQAPAHGGPRGKQRRPRRLSRRPALFGAAGLLVLAAVGGTSYALLDSSHSTAIHPGSSLRLPTSNPTAGIPGFSAKLGKWQHIGTRKLDPVPLSVTELFPPAFSLNGSQYTRAAAQIDKNCGLAVFGTTLQTALTTGKCTQVARASYVSGDRKMMGTIGVVNLTTATAAQQAGQVTNPDELIAPLSTSKGPTRNLLSGTGLVFAEVKGHYLILMYAEFTDLKSPRTDAQKQQLVGFATDMFNGSANFALDSRLLHGKPA